MSLKALKTWQIVVIVMVIIAIVGGGYAIYHQTTASNDSELPANTQLVAVQYGNIINSVSASGSVVFPNREQLIFGIAGTVGEMNVHEGDTVEEGQVLAKLDSTSDLSLQIAITQARINLKTAQDNLEKAQNPDINQAQLDVTDAKITLKTAQEALEKAENPYTEADIDQAKLNVINAQIALDKAEDAFEKAEEQYYKNTSVTAWAQDYEIKGVQLSIAKLDLADAEENLAEMQAGADPLEVEQRQQQLVVAQTNLAKAEQALADMQAGNSLEIELRQLEVASAQTALDEAMKMGTVVAPFDGLITSVNVSAGEAVNANTVAIELVNPSVIQVNANLDEIDVAQVKLGQQATVSLDALPDVEISGELSSVAVIGKSTSGVVSYPVTIQLTVPSDVQLREGMSATATLVVQQANNVLVIPNRAIGGSVSNPTVSVMVNGELVDMPVTLGISDDTRTQVVSGLKEGDMVLVDMSGTTSQQGFFGGGMMGPSFQYFEGR